MRGQTTQPVGWERVNPPWDSLRSIFRCGGGELSSALLCLLAGLVFLCGCARNPVTGKKQLVLVSEAEEIAIGREAHPAILDQFGAVEDTSLQSYLNTTGQKLAALSHRPGLDWKFTVVDDPIVNAFAVPGGFIYVSRGILAYMNNEAELAGVLGHEIGHVTARHSVSQLTRSQLFGLGLGLGAVFSPSFERFGDLAQLGVGVLFLKYSRDHERQSDELGSSYMYQAGYDPHGLADFFVVFENLRDESSNVMPGWLSTHPDPPDRIRAASERADQLVTQGGTTGSLKVEAAAFLEAIDGLVFGPNPREGFVEGDVFYHPDLAFRLQFPAGWSVRNTRQAVLFVEESGNAALQLTLAPPDVPARDYAARQAEAENVELLESRSTTIHGNPAVLARYRITDPSVGILLVRAAFIRYGEHLYQFLGISEESLAGRFTSSFDRSLNSFRRLSDGEILAVQPDRIELYRVRRGGTLADVARRYPNPRVQVEDLALLNRIDQGTRLGPGTVVKVIVSGR